MWEWREYKVYEPSEFIAVIPDILVGISCVFDSIKRRVYAVAGAFDIETSRVPDTKPPVATMYHWQFVLNGYVCLGRTWDEFLDVMFAISAKYLNRRKHLYIYVHNFSYEFHFIQRFFKWERVVAREELHPIYAETECGIVFKCSYMLSHSSLKTLSEKFVPDTVKGELDYEKPRHTRTELTRDEIEYCIRDVVIIDKYIQSEIARNGDITHIPNTQTGYMRRLVRDSMYPPDDAGERQRNHAMMNELYITSESEYSALKYAFAGGFVHANYLYVQDVLHNVASYDISSSYPTVMVSELFPMSSATYYDTMSYQEFIALSSSHCIVACFTFTGFESRPDAYEHILSASKALHISNSVLNNGRIVSCDSLTLYLTSVDMESIPFFYDFESVEITDVYAYEKAPLPKPIIEALLQLFADKTTLKNVEGQEEAYLHSKEILNAMYGGMVTDIVADKVIYTSQWATEEVDVEEALLKYNRSRKFVFYPWGVFVTAYARRNLFQAIHAVGIDHVYSDTDSEKFLNPDEHTDFFEQYNKAIAQKITKMLDYHCIPHDTPDAIYPPVNPKGETIRLGLYEYEGTYTRFKTLGAKRYLAEKSGKYTLTAAGISKNNGLAYITSQGVNPFDVFDDNMVIPETHSGKLAAHYNFDHYRGHFFDYNGVYAEYEELTNVALVPAKYHLSLSAQFAEYLKDNKKYRAE